jgi:hypothetical protein
MQKHFMEVVMSESHRGKPSAKAADPKAENPFAEFLNPNSMITPGAAGAFTMVIANTLCQQFAQLPLNYTGLAVSFMFGAVVFGYGASLVSRMVYFLINSLIIFVVANGSNAIGVRISGPDNVKTASLAIEQPAGGKTGSFALATADTAPAKSDTKPPPKPKFFRQW